MGAVRLLAGQGTLCRRAAPQYLQPAHAGVDGAAGLARWVMPLEMSVPTWPRCSDGRPDGMETEVFAYGRLPLAFSARCFTARHYNLPKDDCRFRCLAHGDGLPMRTREGEPFLVLNGIQTQSARVHNLMAESALRGVGVDVLRISPQSEHTGDIVALFHDVVQGARTGAQALAAMTGLMPDQPCNGYWHGRPGLEMVGAA